MQDGYWADFGAGSTVDWCEPNYLYSAYVAEFWNTVSCAPMVILGLYGMSWSWRQRRHIEARFVLCFAVLALVGVGSAAFHGTLLEASQALDELPMIYGGLVLFYCLVVRDIDAGHRRGFVWRVALSAYAVVFTVAYAVMDDGFTWFILSYAGIVTLLVLGGARIAFGASGTRMHRRLYVAAAVSFVGAVFGFWFPEHILFGCDHPIQALQLHAGWHVLAGGGVYWGFLFAIWDRLQASGGAPALRGRWPAPWISATNAVTA